MKVKITQIEQDWMVVQDYHQQLGWKLEVDDDVAERWDCVTKMYASMQSEIEKTFNEQEPKSEHFNG